jgi:DNA-binding response OmpR family regulator
MKQRILIVDDSEVVLSMASDALEEAGFETTTATTGLEANRHIFSSRRPDLIILDVMMPMLDGDKKARLLKENALCCDIPILLLSSKNDEELRRLTCESGANGYIRKPFTSKVLVSSVRSFLPALC